MESIIWARRIAGSGASFNLLHDFGGVDGWSMGRFENPIIAVRAAHRSDGRCGCGEPLDTRPDGTTVATCCVCRDRQRRQSTRRYLAARSSGGCTWPGCVTAAAPGRRRCEAHLQRDRETNNARRAAARLAAAADRVKRAPQIAADAEQRIREGLCSDCWRFQIRTPAVDGFRCQKHVNEHEARLAKRRAAAVLRRRAARLAEEIEAVRLVEVDRGGGSKWRDRPVPYRAGNVTRTRAESGGLSQIPKWG